MIFTARFGALAARPNFNDENLDRELGELLDTNSLEDAAAN